MPAAGWFELAAGGTGLFVGVVGIAAGLWASARVRGVELTVNIMAAANSELRAEAEHERTARINERDRYHKEISDERVECARAVARIEGQLQALTDGLAERIVAATITALHAPDRRIVSGIVAGEAPP